MASLKAEKTVGTQLFGQVKKEPAKASDGASKPAAKKGGAQKPQQPSKKKKGKGGKAASKP